jgi:hypothetical protein
VWVRHKRLIRANLILWTIVLALWEIHFGLLPKITIHPFISGNPFGHQAQPNKPGLSGQAEAIGSPPAATVVPPQLGDGEGIPSPPPTVLPTETATAEPTAEALAPETPVTQFEPSSTPDTGILTLSQPVIFNMQTDVGGAIAGGEEGACVDGYVKVHAGPTQATVLFQLGNQYVSADVDQDGHYRKCGLTAGTWGAVVQTLGGNAYQDGNSFQSIVVTEGQVTIASWYEIENPTKTPAF